MEAYRGTQFVGIDLHRRRSVLVRMDQARRCAETVRVGNSAENLTEVLTRAGECPEVVLEATYGRYWAADALAEAGAKVHLAHPLGVKAFEYGVSRTINETPPTLPTCSGRGGCRRAGSPRRRPANCASWCATGPSWSPPGPV